MKAIMLVLSPGECVKLLNGDLSVLVRKKFSKDFFGWVYVYCTKGGKLIWLKENSRCEEYINGKVVARFWCNKVKEIKWELPNKLIFPKDMLENACLSGEELYKYLGEKGGYAIHITNLEIFDEPKEISEFRYAHCDNLKNVKVVHNYFYDDYIFQYFDNERCRKCIHYNSDYNDCLKDFKPLTHAPRNGLCYIEVLL